MDNILVCKITIFSKNANQIAIKYYGNPFNGILENGLKGFPNFGNFCYYRGATF